MGSYLDFGHSVADLNEGISFVASFAFTSDQAGSWERVFDFGSGPATGNFVLARQGGGNDLTFIAIIGGVFDSGVIAKNVIRPGKLAFALVLAPALAPLICACTCACTCARACCCCCSHLPPPLPPHAAESPAARRRPQRVPGNLPLLPPSPPPPSTPMSTCYSCSNAHALFRRSPTHLPQTDALHHIPVHKPNQRRHFLRRHG